jgi:4'-phosphopantetheinyl transferase
VTNVFWLEQRSRDIPPGNEWLAESELVRLAKLRFTRRREDWRLGRWSAKQAVVAYLDLPGGPREMAKIEIRALPNGAPEALIAGRRASVSLSLSHRAGIGFCSVAPFGTVLGCDVEAIEPRMAGFVEDYFIEEEQELVRHAAAADKDRLITLLWSAKESVLKALGVGLRRATTDVRVHPAGSGSAGTWKLLCAHTVEGGIFHGWYRESGALLRTIAVAVPGGCCLVQA